MKKETDCILAGIGILLLLILFWLAPVAPSSAQGSAAQPMGDSQGMLILEFSLSNKDLRALSIEVQDTDTVTQEYALLEYLSSSAQPRKVSLHMNGTEYEADLVQYDGTLSKDAIFPKAFSFVLKQGQTFNQIKKFHIYQPRHFSVVDWRAMEILARDVGIYSPDSMLVALKINGMDYGQYLMVQDYDSVFTEPRGMAGSIIFKADSKASPENVVFLLDETNNSAAREHVSQFFRLAKEGDPNILVKFFDFDYLARWEAMRRFLNASGDFTLSKDSVMIYDLSNGRFYPVFDAASFSRGIGQAGKNPGIVPDPLATVAQKIMSNQLVAGFTISHSNDLDEIAKNISSAQDPAFFFLNGNVRGAAISPVLESSLARAAKQAPSPVPDTSKISQVESYVKTKRFYLDEMVLDPAEIAKNSDIAIAENPKSQTEARQNVPEEAFYFSDFGQIDIYGQNWVQLASMENDSESWMDGMSDLLHHQEGNWGRMLTVGSVAQYWYSWPKTVSVEPNDTITFWVYANAHQTGGVGTVGLGPNNSNVFAISLSNISSGWNFVRALRSEFVVSFGTPSWENISYVYLDVNMLATPANLTFTYDDLRLVRSEGLFYNEKESSTNWVAEGGIWEIVGAPSGQVLSGLDSQSDGKLRLNRYVPQSSTHRVKMNLNGGQSVGYQVGDFFISMNASGELSCAEPWHMPSYVNKTATARLDPKAWFEVLLVDNSSFVQAYYRNLGKTFPVGDEDSGKIDFTPLCSGYYDTNNGEVTLRYHGGDPLFSDVSIYAKSKPNYDQIVLRYESDKIILGTGNYFLDGTLFIPAGREFVISEGTEIQMGQDASLVSYSPIRVLGTLQKPVIVRAADPTHPFAVFAVQAMRGSMSTVSSLYLSNGNQKFINGVFYSGGLNFHDTSVNLSHSQIFRNRADDGMNIKRGSVHLDGNRFYSNYADQVDLDSCEGDVVNNSFAGSPLDSNGDGLDISWSNIYAGGNSFVNSRDKGVSIGESSIVVFQGNTISGNKIGTAVKDSSQALFLGNDFLSNNDPIMAYQKKSVFGGGRVFSSNNRFTGHDGVEVNEPYSLDRLSFLYLPKAAEGENSSPAPEEAAHMVSAFRSADHSLPPSNVGIRELSIGGVQSRIDPEGQAVFAQLPAGSATVQNVRYELDCPGCDLFIEPSHAGRDMNKSDPAGAGLARVNSGTEYDFGNFIFFGKIYVRSPWNEYFDQLDPYEIYATTGSLPILDFDTSEEYRIPKKIRDDEKTLVQARIFAPDPDGIAVPIEAFLDGRGAHMYSEKWKYSLTLRYSQPMLGMAAAKDWILESSMNDESLIRNKLALDIMQDIWEDHGEGRMVQESRFVEVFIDGDYMGVYTLLEKPDGDFYGLDAKNGDSANPPMLFQAENGNANFERTNLYLYYYGTDFAAYPYGRQPKDKSLDPIYGWHSGYVGEYPPAKAGPTDWAEMDKLVSFTATSSSSEFESKIRSMVDSDNLADMLIFINLLDHHDGQYKNQYLIKGFDGDSRWRFASWDFDDILKLHDFKTNNLFCRLIKTESFRSTMISRWSNLRRSGIISESSLVSLVNTETAALADAQERNHLRFPNQYANYLPQVDAMKQRLAANVKQMDILLSGPAEDIEAAFCRDTPIHTVFLAGGSGAGAGVPSQEEQARMASLLAPLPDKAGREMLNFTVIDGELERQIGGTGLSSMPPSSDFYSITDSHSRYVFLRIGQDYCNISSSKKEFVLGQMEKFRYGPRANLFIFLDKSIFLSSPRYANLTSALSGSSGITYPTCDGQNDFYSEIVPKMMDTYKVGEIYFIAPDLGRGGVFYDNYAGLHFISASLGPDGSGALVKVVAKPYGASVVAVDSSGQQLERSLEDFSWEYWQYR